MYYLKSKKLVIFVAILTIFSLAITLPVFAASSNFLQKAAEAYQRFCTKRSVSLQNAISCYAFDKLSELESRLDQTEADNATQSAKITELEQRIKALEDQPTPTPTPAPFEFVFFQGAVSTNGAVSQVADGQGFTRLQFSFQCIIGEAAIFLQFSADQTNWTNQISKDPTQCKNGEVIDLSPAARYYRVLLGLTTNPSLSVNAIGHFSYK